MCSSNKLDKFKLKVRCRAAHAAHQLQEGNPADQFKPSQSHCVASQAKVAAQAAEVEAEAEAGADTEAQECNKDRFKAREQVRPVVLQVKAVK